MKLYVANCTRQTWQVQYRLDYTTQGEREPNSRWQPAKQQDIPPGRQVQLGGDMHMMQIEDIVQQLSKFGLVGCVDVPKLRTAVKTFDPGARKTTPLVFNIDKPVPADVMRHVQHHNSGIMVDQGVVRRKNAAIAVNNLVQEKVSHEFMAAGFDEPATDKIDVGFEQLEQSEAGEKTIAEGYHVSADAPADVSGRKPSRRKR